MCITVSFPAAITLGTLILFLALWTLAAWLQRRYERTETRRLLEGLRHTHHWVTGEVIDGRSIGKCPCGAERVFLTP